jgi:hypothetical protein
MSDDNLVDLRDIKISSTLLECVQINPDDLDREFCSLPSDYAYWGEQYSDATEAFLRAKLACETARAKAHLFIKADALQNGEKITVGDLDARVSVDDDYLTAAAHLVETEANMKRLRVRVDSMSAKLDMLQSIGAKQRAMMHGDPAVREEIAGKSLVR